MKILIDLLAIQSESSRGRGIGRYSEELSQEILKFIPKNIKIALNSLYSEHKDLISLQEIQKYTILDISEKSFQERDKYNKLNTFLLKMQFNKNKNTDIIHFFSIFEGLNGKADILHDFSEMPNLKKVITLYDLIPLIYKDIYLSDNNVRKWYFNKLRLIYEADLLLAISDATMEDAINILGIPPSKVVNISGAIENNKFYKMDIAQKDENISILKKYSISQPYIMYTGGVDFRKNIESSIKAFAKIDTHNFNTYQYVIVCKITDNERNNFNKLLKELNIKKNKVVFTGFVSDQELNFLYNASSLFIFPSIYEGFGLPVLEAMACGKIVIGSNISSVPEIIGRDDCMFDPTDIDDITKKINYILNNEHLKVELENYFYNRSKQFSWKQSAKTTLDGYKELEKKKKENIQKINIAFFSPLPNKKSGISDYSLELLPFMSKYFNLDIYVDNYEVEDDYLNNNFNIYNYKDFEIKKEQYENIIYQFGNSEYHKYMYNIAINNPGIIVLHDFFLSGLVQYIANRQNDPQFFFENLKYSHGVVGDEYYNKIMSHEIDVGEITRVLPINKKIIDSAKAVIVHSSYAKQLFKKYYSDNYNVYEIKQLIKTPSEKRVNSKIKNKELLGFQSSDIIISAFGHIADTKQYDFILDLFQQENIFKNKDINLIFVGDFVSDVYKEKINKLIKKHKFNRVKITGFVSDEDYQKYLLASDVGINLRVDSRGETSRALLMNMAYALPTIINDYASFSELPDKTTSKVELNSKADFALKLNQLIDDKIFREKMAEEAYGYIVVNHSVDEVAKEYYDIVFNNSTILPKQNNAIKEIATILVENNLDQLLSKEEYCQVATILKDTNKEKI